MLSVNHGHTCPALTFHRHSLIIQYLEGRLAHIMGYNTGKKKAVTWEQITLWGFSLVAPYCVSVPRLLHCPAQAECYQETSCLMAPWLTGYWKTQYWLQEDAVTKHRSSSESSEERNRVSERCCMSSREEGSHQAIAG